MWTWCLLQHQVEYLDVKEYWVSLLAGRRWRWQLISDYSECWMFSATTLSGCYRNRYAGMHLWTAGQRVDPSCNSTFVWRVKSTDTYSETISEMTYTNWAARQPDYWHSRESCLNLFSGYSYTWNDNECNATMCSICELDK